MTLEELKALPIDEMLEELKNRKTEAPNVGELKKDWDADLHDVNDKELRKDRRVPKTDAIVDQYGKVIKEPEYESDPVNRITLPLEQDIVGIQTAFTVGNEPKLTFDNVEEDEKQKGLFDIIKGISQKNKLKYQNKRIMRSWLSEQEVAEYWYTVDDDTWWLKLLRKINPKLAPEKKLKSTLWSPFRGDKLYPYFDEHGDLIAFSREYNIEVDGEDTERFMVITATDVTVYEDEEVVEGYPFNHGFEKIPVMYLYREKPYCHNIRTIRSRLETLLSNFADCLDYNFAPKLVAKGVVESIVNRGSGSEVIQLENGAEIAYLTWQQSPEMARMELDNLTERAYAMTNTPRISMESLQGVGNAISGRAFKYAFMSAHMQVSNHAEDLEEFLQRRVNFLISAVGNLYAEYKDVSEYIDIGVEVIPFTIDNRAEDIDDAIKVYEAGLATRRSGIMLAGVTDAYDDELTAILEEEAEKLKNEPDKEKPDKENIEE